MIFVDQARCANIDFGPCFYVNRKAAIAFTWDWFAQGGRDDGVAYHVYRVDSGHRDLIDTVNDQAFVLQHERQSDVASKCYAVTAFVNQGPESALSGPACVPANWQPRPEF